ncbi:MAG: hypothetical protein UU24_C0006G0021 [Candidatus Nomurabacteria bacterium GW2011_GWA2_40_9]|uniref:Uncharacterized protein n=1 Tax=Candidatus Nomurabacteria bacterium GW2011_GWA2_40_9 TaxID=1618734 RepID=A0A0G0WVT1_9BACT|nr:MAG: hypothetical protein UU24_C0006G0021 [Candidatus Nomurabacteria bacterium GW2011_GWA2_40_9]
MNYEYHHKNTLENPCNYMYTPFYGDSFLKSYFRNRENSIAILQDRTHLKTIQIVDIIKKENIEALFYLLNGNTKDKTRKTLSQLLKNSQEWLKILEKKERVNTLEIFENLLIAILLGNKKSHKNICFYLNIFLKRYELSKHLFTHYNGSTFKKSGGDYTLLSSYVYFSLLLSLAYFRLKNIKYLNTTLKINDMLCSNLNNLQNHFDRSAFFISLILEIHLVKLLMVKKGLS